jgi:MFS family permease
MAVSSPAERAGARSRPLKERFPALAVAEYRRYILGQIFSMAGNLAQVAGQSWLVLELTDSAVAVGVISSLQFLPVFLLGARAGSFVGRHDRRAVLIVSNAVAGVVGIALGVATMSGVVTVVMIGAAAFASGVTLAFDSPARSLFVLDLVGARSMTNAVSLNSVVTSAGRIIGPTVAAILIATVGSGACFVVNGVSYLTLCVVLSTIHARNPRPAATGAAARRPFATLRTLGPPTWWLLGLIATFGMFVFEFEVFLPLLARLTFDGGAGTYGSLSVAFGGGAVLGGLVSAAAGRTSPNVLLGVGAALAVMLLLGAAAPTVTLACAALVPLGALSVSFLALANSLLLSTTPDEARGAVAGLWTTCIIGAKPFGALLAGAVSELGGARLPLAIGGVALVAVGIGARSQLSLLQLSAAETAPAAS